MKRKPGRLAIDGAVGVRRVNIALTDSAHQKLKLLAGPLGASAWIRQAIENAYKDHETHAHLPA
jgi:hypothetical protein